MRRCVTHKPSDPAVHYVFPSLTRVWHDVVVNHVSPLLSLQVWELTASGVILVSAIGNDGPLYGCGSQRIPNSERVCDP